MKTQEEIEQIAAKEYWNSNTESKSFIKGYTQCQKDILQDQTVTRFEVIDENGRVYVAKECKVELSYQDDGRTLKVFIKEKQINNVKNNP